MNRIVEAAIKEASDAWARKATDKQEQVVTVTRHNIKAAFADAIAKSEGVTLDTGDIETITNAAFNAMKASLERSSRSKRGVSQISQKLSDSNKIVFLQKRYSPAPFRAMKKAGKKVLKGLMGLSKDKALPADLNKDIDMGAQRLHETGSLTVGITRLKKVTELIDSNKFGTSGSKFIDSKAFKNIFEKYGEIFGKIEIVPVKGKPDKIEYKGQVEIGVKRKARNFPGSEEDDWTKIQPLLQKAVAEYLKDIGLADKPGSKSIREESVEHAHYAVLSKLTSGKNIRKTNVKKPTKKTKKGTKGKKSKGFIPKKGKNLAIAKIAKSSSKQPGASLYTVMALINDKLPETVKGNMGAPRLENQTGKFAQSVRLTGVIQTPQGMPSFGYTYAKSPYAVFESSSGSRFASVARDPRSLIDASIREIAAGYALGRFYTRRQ
jgi:hypothetical protein